MCNEFGQTGNGSDNENKLYNIWKI
jgi:hypothetical protein